MNKSIKSVVERISKDIPGAYSYVFDSSERRFIYKSEDHDQMEKVILSLDNDNGLTNLFEESQEKLVQLDCEDTSKKFLIKRLASDIFFGMCVPQTPELIEKASYAMSASFRD